MLVSLFLLQQPIGTSALISELLSWRTEGTRDVEDMECPMRKVKLVTDRYIAYCDIMLSRLMTTYQLIISRNIILLAAISTC